MNDLVLGRVEEDDSNADRRGCCPRSGSRFGEIIDFATIFIGRSIKSIGETSA